MPVRTFGIETCPSYLTNEENVSCFIFLRADDGLFVFIVDISVISTCPYFPKICMGAAMLWIMWRWWELARLCKNGFDWRKVFLAVKIMLREGLIPTMFTMHRNDDMSDNYLPCLDKYFEIHFWLTEIFSYSYIATTSILISCLCLYFGHAPLSSRLRWLPPESCYDSCMPNVPGKRGSPQR